MSFLQVGILLPVAVTVGKQAEKLVERFARKTDFVLERRTRMSRIRNCRTADRFKQDSIQKYMHCTSSAKNPSLNYVVSFGITLSVSLSEKHGVWAQFSERKFSESFTNFFAAKLSYLLLHILQQIGPAGEV